MRAMAAAEQAPRVARVPLAATIREPAAAIVAAATMPAVRLGKAATARRVAVQAPRGEAILAPILLVEQQIRTVARAMSATTGMFVLKWARAQEPARPVAAQMSPVVAVTPAAQAVAVWTTAA